MEITVIRGNDLKRERWEFNVREGPGDFGMVLEWYSTEDFKPPTLVWRGKKPDWQTDKWWSSGDFANLPNWPPLPTDVVKEVKAKLCEQIQAMEVRVSR